MIQLTSKIGLGFNLLFEKYMFVIIPACLLLGFLLSSSLISFTYLVPCLFAYITFIMALGCNWRQIINAFRVPKPILLTLGLVHIAAPSLAYLIGVQVFGADSPYVVGLVLFAVIPLGVSSIIWIGISAGNVALALSMIVLDSALSPFVVPLAISLFFGKAVQFNHFKVMEDLFIIIVIPTILGIFLNQLTKGRIKAWVRPIGTPLSKLAFIGVVIINAAVITPHVIRFREDMLLLIPLVAGLISLFYLMGFLSSFLFKNRDIMVTLIYSSGMRNNSLGVVIALAYFEPKAAVPVVLSIVLQQPAATLIHKWMGRKERNRE